MKRFDFQLNLGLILSPGVITSKSLLDIAMETVHELKMSCGPTRGVLMRGVIKLLRAKTGADFSRSGSSVTYIFWPIFVSLCIGPGLVVLFPDSASFLSVIVPFAVMTEILVPESVVIHLVICLVPLLLFGE